jgi:hypothetical protein
MRATLERLMRLTDGWLFRFQRSNRLEFDAMVTCVKAEPVPERAWREEVFAGRGGWWLSRHAFARLGPLFPNYHTMLSTAGCEEEEETPPRSARFTRQSEAQQIPAVVVSAFATLCLLPQAPLCVIQAAYRALAKLTHPDHSGDEVQMKHLNLAYEEARAWAEQQAHVA